MTVEQKDGDIIVKGLKNFSLRDTLDCGQSFRWEETAPNRFFGVAYSTPCTIEQLNDDIVFYNTDNYTFDKIWYNYFDLDRDYEEVKKILCQDETLRKAAEYAPGIRVLRQDSWEALCSFIISQNNNIKRIKGIVARLCENFGEKISEGVYDFPTAYRLAQLTSDDLAPIRCGFRARYIIDAAQRVSRGDIDMASLYTCDIDSARKMLMQITGVGIKVADCALLYGFGRIDCFPVDVWIRRAMEGLMPQGLPDFALPFAGIAQQYIFHYVRMSEETSHLRV